MKDVYFVKDNGNDDTKGLKSNLMKIFIHPFPWEAFVEFHNFSLIISRSGRTTVSPVKEAFGLDGIEENDFEQDNEEIKESHTYVNNPDQNLLVMFDSVDAHAAVEADDEIIDHVDITATDSTSG